LLEEIKVNRAKLQNTALALLDQGVLLGWGYFPFCRSADQVGLVEKNKRMMVRQTPWAQQLRRQTL